MKLLLLSIFIVIVSLYRNQLQDLAARTTQVAQDILAARNLSTPFTTSNRLPVVDDHLFATDMSIPRAIRKVFLAVEQAEGAGARVRRSIGTPNLRNFSPFLMLDHFSIKPGAGFPDHPHRGQE